MRTIALSLITGAALTMAPPAAPPAAAQDIEDIITGAAQSLIAQELDKNAYIAAQNANTISAYRDYLQRFPNGVYRNNAERAIARLGGNVKPTEPAPGDSAAAVEASLGLSRAQRVRIQQQLTALGYPTGGADGLWGRNTRNAIVKWQTANNATATGYVTAQQVRLIGQQAGTAPAPAPGDDGADYQLEERLLGLTASERREVQRRLTALGYNTFGADGVFGRNTRRALADWQRDAGERPTGYITADQLRALRQQS